MPKAYAFTRHGGPGTGAPLEADRPGSGRAAREAGRARGGTAIATGAAV